jgi:hypothetical protein
VRSAIDLSSHTPSQTKSRLRERVKGRGVKEILSQFGRERLRWQQRNGAWLPRQSALELSTDSRQAQTKSRLRERIRPGRGRDGGIFGELWEEGQRFQQIRDDVPVGTGGGGTGVQGIEEQGFAATRQVCGFDIARAITHQD